MAPDDRNVFDYELYIVAADCQDCYLETDSAGMRVEVMVNTKPEDESAAGRLTPFQPQPEVVACEDSIVQRGGGPPDSS
jgi:hypothetical protein